MFWMAQTSARAPESGGLSKTMDLGSVMRVMLVTLVGLGLTSRVPGVRTPPQFDAHGMHPRSSRASRARVRCACGGEHDKA